LSRSPAAPAFLTARNERRNITAGQKAMAHAILCPEATEKGGRGKKLSGNLSYPSKVNLECCTFLWGEVVLNLEN
jgi:hypothetical protein